MFGHQFYPTPPELAEKMVAPFASLKGESRVSYILEPSAGSGALIQALIDATIKATEKRNEERKRLYDAGNVKDWRDRHYESTSRIEEEIIAKVHACEIDPDLQDMLRGKEIKIVNDDFMTYETFIEYDLIMMNPPFDNAIKHINKAWGMLAEGGNLVALMNADNLLRSTPTVNAFKSLVKNNGSAVKVGKAFQDADRPTGVEVAIIRLQKREGEKVFTFLDEIEAEYEKAGGAITPEEFSNRAVASRDVIKTLLTQYNQAAEHYKVYVKASSMMRSLTNNFDFTHEESTSANKMTSLTYNDFLLRLNRAAWRTVFRLTGMQKRMTERMRQQFEKHEKETAVMAFTRENINKVLLMLVENSGNIMKQCILDCYDELTRYTEDNSERVEGWKTNNAYRVKRKVIIPYCVEFSYGHFSIKYTTREGIIADLDKAMCFLTGKKIEDISTINDACEISRNRVGKTAAKGIIDTSVESTFFELKFFKKGTLHIKFKDERLWNEFNILVARERGWLPDNEDAGKYSIVPA